MKALLSCTRPRYRWACVALLLLLAAVGYLCRVTSRVPPERPHRYVPHNRTRRHGPRHRAEEAGMFDYAFKNGSLADRAFPVSQNRISAVLQRPLTQLGTPASCRFQGAAAESIRYVPILGETYEGKVAPVSVVCTFPGPELAAARSGDVLEITGLGVNKTVIEHIPVLDYRQSLSDPFDWTVCVPSLHGPPRYQWIDQWLYYYTDRLKVDHVFIYSALEGQASRDLGESGVSHGLERISLMNVFSQLAFHPYYHGQVFAMHDCLALNRHLRTEWVMFQDFDEVLTIPGMFLTPFDYFHGLSLDGETALTFGNWFVSIASCLPETEVAASEIGWQWIVRMLPYSAPHCGSLCPDSKGRRKFVLRPSEHDLLFIHNPCGGYVRHVDVNAGYMRHYRGVTDSGDSGSLFGICSYTRTSAAATDIPPGHTYDVP